MIQNQQTTPETQTEPKNRAKQTSIRAALALIAAGLCISFCAALALRFDFTKMNTVDFVTNTYTVDEEFSNVSVDGAECDIRLLASEDGICKVVCTEGENISHSVTVENGTLSIVRHDTRRWHMYFGVHWGSMEILVYLPQSELETLHAQSVSGDIEVPENFSFSSADVKSTSGDISFSAMVKDEFSADTTSGNIQLSGIQCQNAEIGTTSGDIRLSGIQCQNAEAGTTSGDILLTNLTAADVIRVQSVSGDITLQQCDAASLWFSSTSGNIFGSLLTEKQFDINTTSGDIRVPNSSTGGACKASTVSGDIEFSILP